MACIPPSGVSSDRDAPEVKSSPTTCAYTLSSVMCDSTSSITLRWNKDRNGRCVRFRCDSRENPYSMAAVSAALRPGSPPSGCCAIRLRSSPATTDAGTSFTGGIAICIASGCPPSKSSNSPKSAPARVAGTPPLSITKPANANRSVSVRPPRVSVEWGMVIHSSSSRRLNNSAPVPTGPVVTSPRNAAKSGNSVSSSSPGDPSGNPATFSTLSQTSSDGFCCK